MVRDDSQSPAMASEESQALFVQVMGENKNTARTGGEYIQIDEAEDPRHEETKGEESNTDNIQSDDEDVSFLKELERENQALERELKAIQESYAEKAKSSYTNIVPPSNQSNKSKESVEQKSSAQVSIQKSEQASVQNSAKAESTSSAKKATAVQQQKELEQVDSMEEGINVVKQAAGLSSQRINAKKPIVIPKAAQIEQ